MSIVISFILLLLALGGGIYLWVKWRRKSILRRKTLLAESSKVPDHSWPLPGGKGSNVLDDSLAKRPQTNASGSASEQVSGTGATGSNVTPVANGASNPDAPAAPPPEDLAVVGTNKESKYAARFRAAAPTIEALAAKLMTAWNEASVVQSSLQAAWRHVHSSRNSSYGVLSIHYIGDGGVMLPDFVESHQTKYAENLGEYKNWLGFSRLAKSSATTAGADFEALRVAIKPFDKWNSHYLPADLEVLCLAAHHMMEVAKSSIERLLKDALESDKTLEKEEIAGKPLKFAKVDKLFVCTTGGAEVFAEGVHADDRSEVADARNLLRDGLVEALDAWRKATEARSAAHAVYNELDALEKQTFVLPLKPTPEEILRYLTEVESWCKQKLAVQRRVKPALDVTGKASKAARDAHKAAQRNRGRATPILNDANRLIDEALIMAANNIVDQLTEALDNGDRALDEMQKKAPKVTDPVASSTSAEAETIKDLRNQSRTVAFALAQRTVAVTKLAQCQQNEPAVDRYSPRVDRTEEFAKYLAAYQRFADRRTAQLAEKETWEEGLELVQMAYDARRGKVLEKVKALSGKNADVIKGLRDKPADELLIVSAAAAKIAVLSVDHSASGE